MPKINDTIYIKKRLYVGYLSEEKKNYICENYNFIDERKKNDFLDCDH